MRCLPRMHLALLGIVVLAGCQGQKPLKLEKSKAVPSGEAWAVTLDPPVKEQTISATVTSTGAPVEVYVILEGDVNKAQEAGAAALASKQPIAGALARQSATESTTLEATVPAGKGFSIVVVNPNPTKTAEVKLTVTGK